MADNASPYIIIKPYCGRVHFIKRIIKLTVYSDIGNGAAYQTNSAIIPCGYQQAT